MVPSNTYFPGSRQDRATWANNFSIQFTDLAVALGFTAGDATANAADCKLIEDMAAVIVQLDVYAKAVRKYEELVMQGQVGDLTPAFPDLPSYSDPSGPDTGVFERIDRLVKLIRLSATYTDEYGVLLGIIPQSPARPDDDDVQPSLKAKTMPGSVVEVKFTRGHLDGILIETKVDNAETWTEAGRFFASPAELVIPPSSQNLPRSVQIRARYLEGNTPVGQLSPAVTAVTQPAG